MDPDYEHYGEVTPNVRVASPLTGTSENGSERIRAVLNTHFSDEITGLENDIYEVDKRLNETKLILDRLRAAILISYYDRTQNAQSGIHPAVKTEIGKCVPVPADPLSFTTPTHAQPESNQLMNKSDTKHSKPDSTPQKVVPVKTKHRIVVGNVSKYIPVDSRQRNDQSTHKWMVYVRGPRENPDISPIVSKVWFFLHPTYKPNDLVEVTSHPFHLTRRGWGEFPVRVQLHLKDCRGRKVDIIHMLKLDRSYTGEQSLGAETHVDVEVEPPLPTPKGTESATKPGQIVSGEVEQNEPSTDVTAVDSTIRHASPHKPSSSEKRDSGGTESRVLIPLQEQVPKHPQHSSSVYSTTAGHSPAKRVKVALVNKSTNNKDPVTNSLPNGQDSLSSQGITWKTAIINGVKVVSKPPTRPDARKPVSLLANNKLLTTSLLKARTPTGSVSLLSKVTQNKQPSGAQSLLHTPSGGKVHQTLNSKAITPADPIKLGTSNVQGANGKPAVSGPSERTVLSFTVKSATPDVVGNLHSRESPLIKCMLPNGKVMFVKKRLAGGVQDSVPRPSYAGRATQSTNSRVPSVNKHMNTVSRLPDATTSTKGVLSDIYNYKMPDITLIHDMDSLMRHLARLYPLVGTEETNHPQLCPTLQNYLSWPVGKRRALELQRANSIKSYIQKCTRTQSTKFYGMAPWTAKQIMVWCRRYLYTPCSLSEDRLILTSTSTQSNEELSLVAKNLLTREVKPTSTSTADADEGIIEVDVDLSLSETTKKNKLKVTDSSEAVEISILPTEEDDYIQQLVSEVSVRLGPTTLTKGVSAHLTAPVMYKLYNVFMEDVIRKSFAAKVKNNTDILTTADVITAIKTNESLSFLMPTFINEGTDPLV